MFNFFLDYSADFDHWSDAHNDDQEQYLPPAIHRTSNDLVGTNPPMGEDVLPKSSPNVMFGETVFYSDNLQVIITLGHKFQLYFLQRRECTDVKA